MSAGTRVALTFVRPVAFGHLVGVSLPPAHDGDAIEALAEELHADERALMHALAPARRATWIGGRVALRDALLALGLGEAPILQTPRGAPTLPPGIAGSIAHKHEIAVALAAPAPADVTLGIDVEVDVAPRLDISPRVLTPAERRRVDVLETPAARARELLVAFAAKEAIYKGLDPWLGRYVSFQEVEIVRVVDGALTATFTARAGEPSFGIELCEEPLAGHVLVTARVQRRGG